MKKTIRSLREERGESETQLAEALGTTLQDVHDLETGIASPSMERTPNGQARARQTPIITLRAHVRDAAGEKPVKIIRATWRVRARRG